MPSRAAHDRRKSRLAESRRRKYVRSDPRTSWDPTHAALSASSFPVALDKNPKRNDTPVSRFLQRTSLPALRPPTSPCFDKFGNLLPYATVENTTVDRIFLQSDFIERLAPTDYENRKRENVATVWVNNLKAYTELW